MDLTKKSSKELYELIRDCNNELLRRYENRISKMKKSAKGAMHPKVQERCIMFHNKIIEMRNKGYKVSEIIKKLNISQNSYYRYFHYKEDK